jgi:hypothetical protein
MQDGLWFKNHLYQDTGEIKKLILKYQCCHEMVSESRYFLNSFTKILDIFFLRFSETHSYKYKLFSKTFCDRTSGFLRKQADLCDYFKGRIGKSYSRKKFTVSMRVSPKANDFEYVHSALTKEQARWGGGEARKNGGSGQSKKLLF